MNIKFIRPQSRFIMKQVLKRDYDTMTSSSQSTIDKVMIAVDIAIIAALIFL